MKYIKCKNCGHKVAEDYCGLCGQKADTHRLSLQHFISHDIIHGLFHLDKKLPQTIKAILLTPGKVAHEYIAGRRAKYYNFFYLLLLLIGAFLIFDSMANSEQDKSNYSQIELFLDKNFKVVLFLVIPFIASVAWIFFRRLKYNIVEMHIIGVLILIVHMIFFFITSIIESSFAFYHLDKNLFCEIIIYTVGLSSILVFPVFAMYDFAKLKYTRIGALWRALVAILGIFFMFIVVYVMVTLKVKSKENNMPLRDYLQLNKEERRTLDSLNKAVPIDKEIHHE